jgi:hypothetical protein
MHKYDTKALIVRVARMRAIRDSFIENEGLQVRLGGREEFESMKEKAQDKEYSLYISLILVLTMLP